jgi:hypothetical protein
MNSPLRPNRILLKICHFFGYRLDEEHQDDITVNIATVYPEKDWDIVWIKFGLDKDCSSSESKLVMDDILQQVEKRLSEDPKLEKRCRNVGQVWTTYYTRVSINESSVVIIIPYIEGQLWNPCEKGMHEAWERQIKLGKLLDEKI